MPCVDLLTVIMMIVTDAERLYVECHMITVADAECLYVECPYSILMLIVIMMGITDA